MNITPLKQKLLKLVQGLLTHKSGSLKDFSAQRWEICASERQHTSPAIYLANDLDKVTAVMADTSWEQEMQRIKGGEVEHAATLAYCISDCVLLDGSLYKGAVRQPLTKQSPPFLTSNNVQPIPQGVLASTFYGSLYFGHWITDDLTMYLAAEALGTPIQPARKPYGHEPGYLNLLNIRPHNVTRAHFDNLTLLDDFSQNSYKYQRYQELRSRLQISSTTANPGGQIFIRRGQQGAARELTNAGQIEQVLQANGFEIIDPEQSTVREIVSTVLGARVVVGLEGSHMSHCFYTMAQNGGLCLLQPPFRFNNVLKNYTDCLGISYGFVVGRETDGGFVIDPNELLKVIDKIETAIA